MEIFKKAFNRDRTSNTKKRTFSNLTRGLNSDYLIYYQSAISNFNAKNLIAAFDDINNAIQKSDINDWKQYAFRANVLEDLSRYNEAIMDYEMAIEYADHDTEVYPLYHQIGYCYLNLKDDNRAIEFYSYAIDLKNSLANKDIEGMDMGVLIGVPFKRMYNNRANAYLNVGKLNESLEDCKKSISHDKNYSNPYSLLSQIYSKAGQEQKAIEFLKMSAQLGNNNAKATLRKIGL